MKTVITHFYNEEYLLPWWLEHHKNIFDFGVLIDYGSTDYSRKLCHDICPHWRVFPSKFESFDAKLCNDEVSYYEAQIPSWRIALTVTEFLVGDVDALTVDTPARMQWKIPRIEFSEWDLNNAFDRSKPLWEQCHYGYRYDDIPYWYSNLQCRSFHNYQDLEYPPGRHFPIPNTDQACIFQYSNCIKGGSMLARRLQMRTRISERDKEAGVGWQHFSGDPDALSQALSVETLHKFYKEYVEPKRVDCSNEIQRYTK